MPKDEFDPEDPLELVGMALPDPDGATLKAMAECFVEEFLWMGHGEDELLQMFRNPWFRGPHLVYRQKGERYVRELIEAVCARLGGRSGPDAPSGAQDGTQATESGGRGYA